MTPAPDFTAISRAVTLSVAGARHLVLMRAVADDRYGVAAKANAALQTGAGDDGFACLTRLDSLSNAFPESHYRQLAGLGAVTLAFDLDAPDWELRLWRGDATGGMTRLASQRGQGRQAGHLTVDLTAAEASRLFVDLRHGPGLRLHDLAWTTPAPETLPVLGLSITTYNKPGFVTETLDTIAASGPAAAGLLDLLLVNNGAAIPGLPPALTVQTLPNHGGTGGFLAAVAHFRARGRARFVIMDDDIRLHPDLMQRLYALSCLVGALHVGVMAEILNIPERRIKEQGANLDPVRFLHLDPVNARRLIDADNRTGFYAPHPVDYSGWWAELIDLTCPAPLPPAWLFIKRDDIFYGVASARAGTPTQVFPNLMVAHSEEGAPLYHYFDLRNELVLRMLQPGLDFAPRDLRHMALLFLLTLRADPLALTNAALADILRGPTFLQAMDHGARLKQLRAIARPPVPIPPGTPRRTARFRQGKLRNLLAFVLPRPGGGEIPVLPQALPSTVGPLRAYYEPVEGEAKGYLRQRSLASVGLYLRALWLIARLARARRRLTQDYRRAFRP